MKKFQITLLTIEDILNPDQDQVKAYHDGWAQWIGHHREPEKPQNVHAFRERDVVITKVWQYSKQIFRAGVVQKNLRVIDPYRTPGEGGYPHPFWHEYHYWQVVEQLFHTSSAMSSNQGEITITPKSFLDLKHKITWEQIIAVQLIRKIKKGGRRRKIEEAHFSFFNRRNELLGQAWVYCLTEPMLYHRLWQRVVKKEELGAKEELMSLVKRRATFLRRLGKNPQEDDIISRLKMGEVSLEELDDLFLIF